MADISKSYASAVTISIALSLGIRRLTAARTATLTGSSLLFLNTMSTYVACAAAGFANAFLMRQAEINTGISVLHPETKEEMGKSKICAQTAVFKTATSRLLLAAPLFIPATLMFMLEKARLYPKSKALKLPVDVALICCNAVIAVPLSVALYPKLEQIKASELEPEFRSIKDSNGGYIKTFLYNKGM
jgi:hypothetical protein